MLARYDIMYRNEPMYHNQMIGWVLYHNHSYDINYDPMQIYANAIKATIDRIESDIALTKATEALSSIAGGLSGGGKVPKKKGKGKKPYKKGASATKDEAASADSEQPQGTVQEVAESGEAASTVVPELERRVTRALSNKPIETATKFEGIAGFVRAEESFSSKSRFLLHNQGNQCYANSTLFLLLSIQEFRLV